MNWRLIDTGELDGFSNMAFDEALLESFDPEKSLPVLRLYGWNPPAFSIGRYQKAEEVLDLEKCRANHIPVVRRITGGGAIYHTQELTYSLVCTQKHLPGSLNVKESYKKISFFLIMAYRSLGLDASYALENKNNTEMKLGVKTPFCFAGKEEYDIVIQGKKIGGNAQKRSRITIFQHGSVPYRQNLDYSSSFLLTPLSPEEKESTDLFSQTGILSPEDFKQKILSAFSENLSISLVETELSSNEKALYEKILNEKK